jgi:hypothetical protein
MLQHGVLRGAFCITIVRSSALILVQLHFSLYPLYVLTRAEPVQFRIRVLVCTVCTADMGAAVGWQNFGSIKIS